MSGGISSFQFSESFNAEVQTFLVPETCYKACNLTAWKISRVVDFTCGFESAYLVRLLPDARVSDPNSG